MGKDVRKSTAEVLEYATPGRKKFTRVEVLLVIGVIALLVSILLPPRSVPIGRSKCASNLRQIGEGIRVYAKQNGGRLPGRLDQLITDADVNAEVFVCPCNDDDKATGATMQEIVADFGKPGRCSYVYLGAGMTPGVKGDVVVVYENFDNHEKEGMNVLYGDGAVKWMGKVEAEKMIKELEAGRNPPGK